MASGDYRQVLGTLTPEMIAAQGDPFMLAYLSGAREGLLVRRARSGIVPTLGLPFLRSKTLIHSNSEIRRAIGRVGGSFDRFFSEVLASAASDTDDAHVERGADENPFARALEALEENPRGDTKDTAVEPKAPSPEKTSTAEKTAPVSESKEGTLASAPAGAEVGAVATSRPYLILRVEDGNVVHSVAASQPHDGTFESVELGLQDFRVFPITDAAEFPLAMAVADFNGDSQADVVFHVPQQRLLRFFYQNAEGNFDEGMRIEVGRAPLSLAAADFNQDGLVDLAFSQLGTGVLTVLYADANHVYNNFRTLASDAYRDYITAADTSGTGHPDVLGMNFANFATVLLDFTQPAGETSGRRIEYSPSLNTELPRASARPSRVNGVLLNGTLALNFDDRLGRLVNVLNLSAGANVYVIIGDLDNAGGLDVGLGVPRR